MSGRRFVTVADIVADTGLARTTVYDMLADGHPNRIPNIPTGGRGSRRLIPRRAYEQWLERLEERARAGAA